MTSEFSSLLPPSTVSCFRFPNKYKPNLVSASSVLERSHSGVFTCEKKDKREREVALDLIDF